MNILYHHRTQGKGVEGVHITEIAKALTKLGHEVDILSPKGLERFGAGEKIHPPKTHSFISRFMPEIGFEILEIFYNFIAGGRIVWALSQKKYEFIYERYAIFNWAGVKSAKKYRLPIILEVNYTSFTPLYRKRSTILKPFAHWLDRRIFAAVNGIVVVSSALKEHLIGLGVSPGKIIVCTNAADPDKFNPQINGQEIRNKFNLNGKKVIGFVGGFYPWHGLDLLIDTFAAIKNEIGDTVLFLIGEGPFKKNIQGKIAALKLNESAILTGAVSHDALPKYIASFDIAVMPDSNDYGSPMKIYEYMAMGKPVVGPSLGPLKDGIADRREGILFAQHDKDTLTAALKTLLLDNELRIKIGQAARENILNSHTWQKNAESLLRFYQQIRNSDKKGGEAKKRILFLTPRPPFPPIKGDQIRPYHFIQELSRKHTIDLCTFYENEKELEGLKEMKKYCTRIETVQLTPIQSYFNVLRSVINFRPLQINYYYSGKMKLAIKNLLQNEQYDVIHIELERMMPYAQLCQGKKIILDEIDALSLNMLRRASTEKNILKKVIFNLEYSLMRRFEQDNQRLWDACIITSEIDKEALHNDNIKVIPNGVDTAYFTPLETGCQRQPSSLTGCTPRKTEKDIDLIFTGNMGYFPNIDAAVYLCEEVMPKVWEKYPDIKLFIVGANPGRKIKSLAEDGKVTVTGFVEDIRQYLNQAKLFVAPLRSGSGIQNKILEAMACGLPVVTTVYGNAGIKAEEEKQIIVRDAPEEISQAIINLLEDENRRNKLGEAARELVEKEFSWSSRTQSIEEIYQAIING